MVIDSLVFSFHDNLLCTDCKQKLYFAVPLLLVNYAMSTKKCELPNQVLVDHFKAGVLDQLKKDSIKWRSDQKVEIHFETIPNHLKYESIYFSILFRNFELSHSGTSMYSRGNELSLTYLLYENGEMRSKKRVDLKKTNIQFEKLGIPRSILIKDFILSLEDEYYYLGQDFAKRFLIVNG